MYQVILIIFAGYAIIQIPETIKLWYGYAKKQWWNKLSSSSSSIVFIEPTANIVCEILNRQTKVDQDANNDKSIGLKTIQHKNTWHNKTIDATSIQRINERIDNIELKLQLITLFMEKITKN